MIGFLKKWVLQSELSKSPAQKQFVEWGQVKTICLIINNDSESLAAAQQFITESGKQVDVVTYTNDKITVNNSVYLSLNKKDLNWLDLPSAEVLKKIRSKNYDIVISGDINNDTVLRAVFLLVMAKCRVGLDSLDYSGHFTLSLSMPASEGVKSFFKQALKYLSLVKTN